MTWSQPEQSTTGYWSSEEGGGKSVGILGDEFDIDAATAPRDVVLRLLAAEASARLGWEWSIELPAQVVAYKDAERARGPIGRWIKSAAGQLIWCPYLSHVMKDEMLASLHGKHLFERYGCQCQYVVRVQGEEPTRLGVLSCPVHHTLDEVSRHG